MKIAGCKWQAADYFAIRHSQLAIFRLERPNEPPIALA